MRTEKRERREGGFSLIELMIVIAIIGILVGVGIPAWQASVRSANETAAITTLQRTLRNAQVTYFNSKNRTTYGTFDQLVAAGLLDKRFAGDAPVVDGYIYTMTAAPKSGSSPATWNANANPQVPTGLTATGSQFFYSGSDTNTVHTNPEKPATPDDPPVGG